MSFWQGIFNANQSPDEEDILRRQAISQMLMSAGNVNPGTSSAGNIGTVLAMAMGGYQGRLADRESENFREQQQAEQEARARELAAALKSGNPQAAIDGMLASGDPGLRNMAVQYSLQQSSKQEKPVKYERATVTRVNDKGQRVKQTIVYDPMNPSDQRVIAEAPEQEKAPLVTVNNNPAKTDPKLLGAPKDMMWVEPGNLDAGVVPIPGSNASKMSPEQAAKAQLMEGGLEAIRDVRSGLINEDGSVDRMSIASIYAGGLPFTEGRQLRVQMLDAIEGKLRAESGAAVPETEVKRIGERFMPSPFDSDELVKKRLDMLERFMSGSYKKMFPNGEYDPRVADEIVDMVFKDSGIPEVPSGVAQVRSDEDYAALPSGAQFIGPDGKLRVKP